MDFTEKDYLDVARDRITYQFRDSTNLDILMRVWLQGYQDLQSTFLDIALINDVDTASGAQLDNIGEIVGQTRELESISAAGYFGFQEDLGAKSFGSLDNNAGGLWYSLGDPDSGNITLPDDLYRLFVKAKIRNNNAGGTAEEIIAATKEIFQSDFVELLEGNPDDATESAVFTLSIGRDWNDDALTVFPGLDETAVADRLLPRATGVRILYINVIVTPTLNAANTWVTASDNLYQFASQIAPDLMNNDLGYPY